MKNLDIERKYKRLFETILSVQKNKERRSCRFDDLYINIESLEKEQPNLILLRFREGLVPKEGSAITFIELNDSTKKFIIEQLERKLNDNAQNIKKRWR